MPLYKSYYYQTKSLFESKEYKAHFKVPKDHAMRTKKIVICSWVNYNGHLFLDSISWENLGLGISFSGISINQHFISIQYSFGSFFFPLFLHFIIFFLVLKTVLFILKYLQKEGRLPLRFKLKRSTSFNFCSFASTEWRSRVLSWRWHNGDCEWSLISVWDKRGAKIHALAQDSEDTQRARKSSARVPQTVPRAFCRLFCLIPKLGPLEV